MKSKPHTSWIPDDLRLPDSIPEIEAGSTPKQPQRTLFGVDDSVMARLKRIKAKEVTPPQRKGPRR